MSQFSESIKVKIDQFPEGTRELFYAIVDFYEGQLAIRDEKIAGLEDRILPRQVLPPHLQQTPSSRATRLLQVRRQHLTRRKTVIHPITPPVLSTWAGCPGCIGHLRNSQAGADTRHRPGVKK